jgi:hypothetical protein
MKLAELWVHVTTRYSASLKKSSKDIKTTSSYVVDDADYMEAIKRYKLTSHDATSVEERKSFWNYFLMKLCILFFD